MLSLIRRFKSRKGQGTVEYALIVVAVIVIIGATLMTKTNPLGTAMTSSFTKVGNAVTAAPSTLS